MRLVMYNELKLINKYKKNAEKVIYQLYEKYPPGLGGILDPCDYCKVRRLCRFEKLDEEKCVRRYAWFSRRIRYYRIEGDSVIISDEEL